MKLCRERTVGRSISIKDFTSSSAIAIILLVLFLLLLLSSHLLHERYGGITVDERAEWYNVKIQLARGIGFLRGVDISEVPVNHYGVVNTFLPFLVSLKLNLPIRDYYHLTHILSVSCAIGTVGLLWWASRICRLRNFWLAPVMLLASPAFFGYSLMNIKDIPIAFSYTLFTCTLLWCHRYLRNFSSKRLAFCTLVASIVAGTFVSLRLTLLPVALATFILMVSVSIPIKSVNRMPLPFVIRRPGGLWLACSTLAFALLVFLLATVLLPASWEDPISFFVEAFNTFRDYTIWDGCTLYMGECTSKLFTKGWTTANYLRQWGFSQPTLLNVFNYLVGIPLAIGAMIMMVKMYRKDTDRQIGIILFSAQAYLVVILAIVTNATLYNGIRHLLFVLPATAFMGSVFVDTLTTSKIRIPLPWGRVRAVDIFLAAVFASLIIVLLDMAALAPYQYTYINEVRRGPLTAGTTELDVWEMSFGELYSNTAKVSPLFPEDINKSLILTRESIGITASASDETKLQQLIKSPIRSPISNLSPGCRVVSEVSRNYALSGHKVIFSAVSECPKGKDDAQPLPKE